MPRSKRIEIPGAVYHVIVRGIEGREIFRHDFDREEFLRRLERGIKETACRCFAWALMPNHIHLLISTAENPLSELMRKILTGYAIYFNRKYNRSGYLFQNRYKSILCQEDTYLLELVRYIHLNPLIGGVVKTLEELDKYWWTGHAVLLGKRERAWQQAEEIWSRFAERKEDAINEYKRFIASGSTMGKRNDLVGGGLRRSEAGWKSAGETGLSHRRSDERILGDPQFVERVLKAADEKLEKRERLIRAGWDLEKLVNRVCSQFSVSRDDLRRKGRKNKISNAKSLIAYLGCKELGVNKTEIAKVLGATKQAVGRAVEIGETISRTSGINLLS